MHIPAASMENFEIVLFATPLMGHLVPAIELANLMITRNRGLCITLLITKLHITDSKICAKIESFMNSNKRDRLRFHMIPLPGEMHQNSHSDMSNMSENGQEYQKDKVREIVSKIQGNLRGFIVDAGNSIMIDVGNEYGVPSYVFFPSGAAFLGLLSHFQALQDMQGKELSDLLKGKDVISSPSYVEPIPTRVLPTMISFLVQFIHGYRKAKAILVNSFEELEPCASDSFLSSSHMYDGNLRMPPVYLVGPILNRVDKGLSEDDSGILDWLNTQKSCSVVFICFGSKGCLNSDQVKEIAYGIEQSGHPFLWCLRRPSAKEGGLSSDYGDYRGVLPKGFIDRTEKVGKIVGWVPQMAVLSHSAIGGFVSHCGWNSALESIRCGVPMATWPLQGDQQLNAFQLVKELGVGVEITMDYDEKRENQEMVKAEIIEKGIRRLMDNENEARKRVKELSRKSKEAMEEGGSSYLALQNVIQGMINGCNGKTM